LRLYKLYILDLDGTLYRGSEALPYAVETVRELRRLGAQVRFLTNNSGLTRTAYVEKLRTLGFDADPLEVYSSATATAAYCCDMDLDALFVIGEPGLVATLREAGLEVLNASDGGEVSPERSEEGRPKAVVVGIHRAFTYEIMRAGMQEIRLGGRFIATNTDATYPLEEDRLVPGAGAIVASLQTCSGIEPYVVGKPNPYMVELVLRNAGIPASEALVIGDRYETDIESAIRAGVDSHLVLTGVTKIAPAGQSASPDLRGVLWDRVDSAS
jgi:4-nitrophenyl phosphatase